MPNPKMPPKSPQTAAEKVSESFNNNSGMSWLAKAKERLAQSLAGGSQTNPTKKNGGLK